MHNMKEEGLCYDAANKVWSGEAVKRLYDRDCSIGKIIFESMRRYPKKICFVSDSEKITLTNEEVLRRAIGIVKFFKSSGTKQSDIIGLCGTNSTYIFSVALACFFHGCAFHSINVLFDEETTKSLFNITKPKIIFCDAQQYKQVAAATRSLKVQLITLRERLAGVKFVGDITVNSDNTEYFEPAELERGTDQSLCILCSSGSTGLPKAVTVPNTTRCFEVVDYLTAEDVCYNSSTIDWLSCLMSLTAALIYGAKLIISEYPYTPEYFTQILKTYNVTFTMQSSTYMSMVARNPNIKMEDLISLKYFLFGGGKCTQAAKEIMLKKLGNAQLINVYGFSEIGTIFVRTFKIREKIESVGRILPGYKVKVIDSDGKSLNPGDIGEVCVSNGEKWSGYVGNLEATLKARDAKGWFYSGDLGYFDREGYLYIVDRKKDILKYKQMHYSPSEIEQVIAEMPNVANVCVVGIFNETVGDAAAAAIEKVEGTEITAEEVEQYVQNHISASYKHLHGGAYIVKELAKTPNGKIHRPSVKNEILRSKCL